MGGFVLRLLVSLTGEYLLPIWYAEVVTVLASNELNELRVCLKEIAGRGVQLTVPVALSTLSQKKRKREGRRVKPRHTGTGQTADCRSWTLLSLFGPWFGIQLPSRTLDTLDLPGQHGSADTFSAQTPRTF